MPKVRQETIKRISEMGMAKALQHANDNNDPEFREAVKRYYPNAKYGPKTRAAAAASSTPAPAPAKAAAPAQRAAPRIMGAAIARRVEPVRRTPEVRVAPPAKPKSMRGVDQKKPIFGSDPFGTKHEGPRQMFGRGVKRLLGQTEESKQKRKKVENLRAGAADRYRAGKK